MPSIGGVSVIGFNGPVQLSGIRGELRARPGVDGQDIHDIGIRGEAFTTTASVDCTNATHLAYLKIVFGSMQGSLVSLTDNVGNIWTHLYCNKVTFLEEQNHIVATGGVNNGTYMLTATFELIPMATSY